VRPEAVSPVAAGDAEPRATLLQRYGVPPEEIERLSLARLEAQAGPALPEDPAARRVALRVLYAAGDPDLAAQVRVHPAAIQAGVAAFRGSAPLIVDVAMVAAGLRHDALRQLGCPLVVAIDTSEAARLAAREHITRSAAGMRLLAPRVANAVVAIGNAPTALLELLDRLDAGAAPPALIVGVPVGMVAATEAKAELARREGPPFVTVLGTRGGSALAAAAVNALLDLALESHDR
jgi:precorrin-8X/cobalt-precorrin-8 methylmutase